MGVNIDDRDGEIYFKWDFLMKNGMAFRYDGKAGKAYCKTKGVGGEGREPGPGMSDEMAQAVLNGVEISKEEYDNYEKRLKS